MLYEDIIRKVNEVEHFTFVRYGDGEWALMLKKEPKYSQILANWNYTISSIGGILLKILKSSPEYFFGVQPLAYSLWKEDIDKAIPDNVRVMDADILHKKSLLGDIDDFFESLKKRNVILVGPEYLQELNLFEFEHVISPMKYIWSERIMIKNDVERYLQKMKDPVVLYSAGVASKVMIDNLYFPYKGKITQLDTGSLFDPYAGVSSRKYHSEVIQRLKARK